MTIHWTGPDKTNHAYCGSRKGYSEFEPSKVTCVRCQREAESCYSGSDHDCMGVTVEVYVSCRCGWKSRLSGYRGSAFAEWRQHQRACE